MSYEFSRDGFPFPTPGAAAAARQMAAGEPVLLRGKDPSRFCRQVLVVRGCTLLPGQQCIYVPLGMEHRNRAMHAIAIAIAHRICVFLILRLVPLADFFENRLNFGGTYVQQRRGKIDDGPNELAKPIFPAHSVSNFFFMGVSDFVTHTLLLVQPLLFLYRKGHPSGTFFLLQSGKRKIQI